MNAQHRTRRGAVAACIVAAVAPIGWNDAIAGPAGGLTGDQQRQTLERVVLVCENDPTIQCPADPADPGYFINGFQFDRVFHTSCDPTFQEACVPLVVAERPATLAVAATELPPDPLAACFGDPDCLNMEVDVDLGVPGTTAPLSIQRSFLHPTGFLRQFSCQGDNDSAGVRISDWFPFRDRDCLFDDGINFEGMLLAGNEPRFAPDGVPTAVDPKLVDFETALVQYAADELGIPPGSVLPTTMTDADTGRREAGNAIELLQSDLQNDQTVGDTRSGSYPLTLRWAVAQRPPALETDELAASETSLTDFFGASLAVSGDVAVVGAPNDEIGSATTEGGAAFVFRWDGSRWQPEARLAASDRAPFDDFGRAVAVDGDRILVGAPFAAVGAESRGAVYAFRFANGTWSEEDKLVASDGAAFDALGSAVALAGDLALAGAPQRSGGRGAAYVFERTGSDWSDVQTLTAPDAAANDAFGSAVALSGAVAAVGAPFGDAPSGPDRGSVYVFRSAGADFAFEVELHAADAAFQDQLGGALASEADVILAGARSAAGLDGSDAGAAYLFRFGGAAWTQEAKLVASDGQAGDSFGRDVSLDGDAALVGAPLGDRTGNSAEGSAYLFARRGASWQQTGELLASDGVSFDLFGQAVALGPDAALVGAPQSSADGDSSQGSVYVFERPRSTLVVDGAAQGGQVRAVVRGVVVAIATQPGESSDDVAANLAAALGADPILQTLAVGATTASPQVALRGASPDDVAVSTDDPGLAVFLATACSNGADDDGDGRIDAADPGCAGSADPSERSPLFACDDGRDNDGDGFTDMADPGCPQPNARPENPICDDGIDNDGDGFFDRDDPVCEDHWPFWEEVPACGVGAELVVVLAALRRRWRRDA
jgi:hypothetical protein